jgi:acetoin utilization protein AcuC
VPDGSPGPAAAAAGDAAGDATGPLLVWGERFHEYDFGPGHPLTPRRFGVSLDLLQRLGADRILAPREADDGELERLHEPAYVRQVRSFSDHPWQPPAMGIGTPDVPAFHGMHEASALVAGGALEAMAAIVAGEAEHAFLPAGGLHHAMAARASGFCVYNDVALAVAAARDAGHRVLYVDLDVHHGDGTQVLFWDDPGVLTFSIHESGQTLFPGTGWLEETGGPAAPGTAVNVPLAATSGDESWWPIVELMVPALADLFAPTVLVSQHGCDSHQLDPLAHLRVTTGSYARAVRLLDAVAHARCEGRWFATGGGGYDAYRVVPRSWALVWLAQAHRQPPVETPAAWRERWAEEAARFGQAPLPTLLLDPAGTAQPESSEVTERNLQSARRALEQTRRLLGAS